MVVYELREDSHIIVPIKVYDISYDQCGYPLFLIREEGQWKRRSAKYYVTEEELDKMRDRPKESEPFRLFIQTRDIEE